jgi:hypothetical protein
LVPVAPSASSGLPSARSDCNIFGSLGGPALGPPLN